MAKVTIEKGSIADAGISFSALFPAGLFLYLGYKLVTNVPKVYPYGSTESSTIGPGIVCLVLGGFFLLGAIISIMDYLKHSKK